MVKHVSDYATNSHSDHQFHANFIGLAEGGIGPFLRFRRHCFFFSLGLFKAFIQRIKAGFVIFICHGFLKNLSLGEGAHFLYLLQVDRNQLADALFAHGDAIEALHPRH